MARVQTHPLLVQALRGPVANLIFYTDENGVVHTRERVKRTAPMTEAELERQDLLKLASVYGNSVKIDPALAEIYRAHCGPRMGPYQAAVRDYMRPPQIDGIDLQGFTGRAGDRILVIATDDTQVLTVNVSIHDQARAIELERGPAEFSHLQHGWVYTVQMAIAPGTSVMIEATAKDRPGHAGVGRVNGFVGR